MDGSFGSLDLGNYVGWFRACEFSIRHDLKSQIQEMINFVKINHSHREIITEEVKEMKKVTKKKKKYKVDENCNITLLF